jgi:AcrR family transcriptional regulator
MMRDRPLLVKSAAHIYDGCVNASVPPVSVTLTARQRARATVTGEILAAARRQLAEEGPTGVSLRAVARDLGMPSSGIYRYFATRDELLTRLIIEAYDSVGQAVEESQQRLKPAEVKARFAAACRAIRNWALQHPHEYGLVFGAPVPRYAAPEATVGAAARVPAVLAAILSEASAHSSPRMLPLSATGKAAIAPARRFASDAVPPERLQAGLLVWPGIFGVISFELFGHLDGSVEAGFEHRDAFFEECIRRWADQLGLP